MVVDRGQQQDADPGAAAGSVYEPDPEGLQRPAHVPDTVRMSVHVEEPVLRFAEDEREGVEDQVGAEPGVLAALGHDERAELRLVGATDEAVCAVRSDDEIRVRWNVVDFDAERKVDAE